MKLLDYKSWNLKSMLREIAIMALMVLVIANVLSYIRKPELGESRLPQIKERLIDAKTFDTAALGGKPLLLHFWATWCPVCKAEADNIQRLSRYYEVVTVAVNSGDDEALKRYMKERGFDYRVINDREGRWAARFDIAAYPTTFVYDRSGEIAFSEVGYTSTFGLWLRLWWAGL